MYTISKWLASLIALLIFLICFSFGLHNKKMQKMTFFYENGFYEKSRAELATINEKKLKYPYAMYQAYLSVGERDFFQARTYLHKAITFSSGKNFLLDMELNACELCCHLADHDLEGMQRSLERFAPLSYDHPIFRFVQGIFAYENGAYFEVVKAWQQLSYFLLQQELTPWGKIALQNLYPQETFQLNLASSFIEIENYFEAREILEQFIRENNSFPMQQNAQFYLGYSYLKEAQHASSDRANSCLKLASFYFDKVFFDQLAERKKKEVLFCIDEMAIKTIKEQTLSAEALTYLIFPLERWKLEENMQKIEKALANRLEKNEGNDLDFFKTFQKIAPVRFFQSLQNNLFSKLQLSLETGSIKTFAPIWNILSSNLETAIQINQLLLSQMLSQLDHLIFSDTEDLQLFQTQIKMLEQKQIPKEQLNAFAHPLFAISTKLWMMPHEEKKAILVMQLAYRLSTKKTVIKTKIENFLLPLFDRAQEANLIERLSTIFDAMIIFHITPKCIDHPTTIANHLEDADYRFHSQHYVQAKALCTWVLKLEPNNQKALKILGLSCYFLGDFEEAHNYLSQLQQQDELTEKARILSEVLGGKSKAELVQIHRFEQHEEHCQLPLETGNLKVD